MKKALILILFLFSYQLVAQKFVIKLDHADPAASVNDLSKLDEYFLNKRVVGLGESTHGTHEFFTMRHRIIRYLAEKHEFNVVFMEADFANSLAINDYITGKGGTAEEAVSNLGLWPWETQELVEMVEWLREYNEANPTNSIEFIGVDVQKLDETVSRLEQLLEKYQHPGREDSVIAASAFYKLSDKEVMNLRALEISRYEGVDISGFSKEDEYEYKWLFRHLSQILSEKLEKKSMQNTYRDKMMAENILEHLKQDEKKKGVFWAHNGHVAYLFDKKKDKGVAGGYLRESLKDSYFILGQEFDFGRFNARVKPVEYSKDYNNWKLEEVEVGQSPEGSLAANYRSISDPFIFIPFERLPTEEMVYINNIGAVYWTNKKGEASEYLRRNHHGKEAFDAIILIKESTPTKLLKK